MEKPANNLKYISEMIRQNDHDRYLVTLYAPEEKRDDLFALYAFNYELSRLRSVVSEPMLGEIRLQWWRDAINNIYQGKRDSHELIPALAKAVERHDLSRERLMDLIESRARDLYDENPRNMAELDHYLDQTSGNLTCLAAQILGQKDHEFMTRKLGFLWGYVELIRAVPYHMTLKQSFMPLSLMGEGHNRFLSPDQPEVMKVVIKDLSEKALQYLAEIRINKAHITPKVRSLFLLTSLAQHYLKAIEKAEYNPFRLEKTAGAFSRQWGLLISAVFNRI